MGEQEPLSFFLEIGQVVPVLRQSEQAPEMYEEVFQVTFLSPIEMTKQEYLQLIQITKDHLTKVKVVEHQ